MNFILEKWRDPASRPGIGTMPASRLIPVLLLGVLLQLQLTLFKGDGYMGLRMNAADFLLPLLGAFILGGIVLKRDRWPQWQVPHLYAVLIALSVLMTFALLNGYATTGHWDHWAVVNKYAGWFILLGYLGIGGWMGARPAQEWLPPIMRAFISFWAITFIGFCLSMLALDLLQQKERLISIYPLDAFMGNRNAYAFLSFSALSIMTAVQMRRDIKPSWYFHLIWAVVPLFYVYNASRSILFIMPLIFLAFLILKPRFAWKHIFTPLIAGALIAYALFSFFPSTVLGITKWHLQNAGKVIELTDQSQQEALRAGLYEGDQIRSKTYGDSWAVFLQNPILGGGLGAYRHYQMQTRGAFLDVADCTPLWLLAETGVVGLVMFAGLFMLALWRLIQKIRTGGDAQGIYLGIVMMMLIFAAMSLVHELLYTRFMWFIMGLGLALPVSDSKTSA